MCPVGYVTATAQEFNFRNNKDLERYEQWNKAGTHPLLLLSGITNVPKIEYLPLYYWLIILSFVAIALISPL